MRYVLREQRTGEKIALCYLSFVRKNVGVLLHPAERYYFLSEILD